MEKLITGSATEMPVIKLPMSDDRSTGFAPSRGYSVANIEQKEVFDGLTSLASEVCGCPVALLSIIDGDLLWHKSKIGLASTETPLKESFCSLTIEHEGLFIVADARKDKRFSALSLVASDPGIRFYAGVPIATSTGRIIGTLSVMDHRPRNLKPSQTKALLTIAAAAMAHFELESRNAELDVAIAERDHKEEMLRLSETLLTRAEERNAELLSINSLLKRESDDDKRAFASLAESEERYALLVRGGNDGMWDWDVQTNEIHFCPRWKAMLGYREDEMSSRPDEWFSRIHPEEVEQVHSELMAHLLNLTPHFQNEHRLRTRTGEYRWMLCRGVAVWNSRRELYRMAGSLIDINDQKETEQQLLHNAFYDALTELPNRALFMDRLKRALDRARDCPDYLFAVLFLDLDRFKVVNDSLGHEIGDHLLKVVGRRLEASLRPGDMVARLGGDEFAVILDHLKHVNDATQAAERIHKELAQPYNLNDHEVFASASIGIALSLTPNDQPEDLLRNADTAMYRAKERGRGGFELFDKGMRARVVALLQLETDLRRAIERDEFMVDYQPIISLASWQITGLEALLRWEHPQQGFISPLEFIPVAEDTGLILQIGQWVLFEACSQLRAWQQEFPSTPPLFISVNLSGKQFLQPTLIEDIKQILAETGVEASSLKIEITESAIIENIESATAMLKQLKQLGIKVSLDDFGTGYSSLSYLHRFPIDTLKIDRSFITRMNLPKNSEIVRTIVTLASNLGMDVIAEGVETGEQIIQLTGMNCEYVQGFLLSKPMDAESVRELIKETRQNGLGDPVRNKLNA